MKENFTQSFIQAARFVLGILLLILGIIGLFLPVLQGVLFIVLAGVVLGKDSFLGKWIFRLVDYIKQKKQSSKSHQ